MQRINELCKIIHNDIHAGKLNFEITQELITLIKNYDDETKRNVVNEFYAEMGAGEELDVWLYSFILQILPEARTLKQLIMFVKLSGKLGYKRKYFMFQQINSMIFKYPELNTPDVVQAAWSLLQIVLADCKRELGLKLTRIPVEDRNKGIAIVLTEQFLSPEHGPTKTALDRCYVLKKCFGQNVMLINTAEIASLANAMYIEHIGVANYIEKLREQSSVSWQGETFNYYQAENNMPSDDGIMELLSFIANLKPASVTLIGGTSLLAGLVNELIPVITVGTIQSGLAITLADYQIIDQNMLEKGYSMLDNMGKSRDHIIPGKFTFSLKPQTHAYSRAELCIPDDKFALVMVGGRLTEEITDEFLDMLEDCMDDSMVAGIVGKCLDYEDKIKRHPKLESKLIYVGFVEDIQAVIENFDLYVNPTRRGGGTSVVEAMSKGLPAITVNYGDVAGIVGEGFCCDSYDEMKDIIRRYRSDKEFYAAKAKEALAMVAEYLDSTKEFTRIMCEYYAKQGYKVGNIGAVKEKIPDMLESEKYISVIVPCYNVEKYVEKCMDSIINQSIGLEHLEIIAVNDCSTDNTLAILKKYEELYPNSVRIVNNKVNKGLSYNRNYGVSIASAPYIAFVDADDWLDICAYEVMYNEIISNDSDIVICQYDRPDSHEIGYNSEDTISYNTNTFDLTELDNRRRVVTYSRLYVYAWNKLYRKSFWIDNGIEFPEGLMYEDNYAWIIALLSASKLTITDAVLYHWYNNQLGITGTHKRVDDRILVQNMLFDKLKELNIYQFMKEEIDFNYYEKMFVEVLLFYILDKNFTIEKACELKEILLRKIPDIKDNIYFRKQREIERLDVNPDAFNLLVQNDITDRVVRDMYRLIIG